MLNDQITSLKLGFASKRKHDPKGFLSAHFKQHHAKIDYVHEEISDDSIYQGVKTFVEVLVRDKSKDEQNLILQYQQEIKNRVSVYRTMELNKLEKARKMQKVKKLMKRNVHQ